MHDNNNPYCLTLSLEYLLEQSGVLMVQWALVTGAPRRTCRRFTRGMQLITELGMFIGGGWPPAKMFNTQQEHQTRTGSTERH